MLLALVPQAHALQCWKHIASSIVYVFALLNAVYLRFPADMVFEEKYEEEDRSATELQQRCGGNLTEMTMSGGTGLFVAVGETNSGKAVTYKSFLLKMVEAMLVKCRNKRKNCFVSFVEIRGSTVTDLMSTNSNMEVNISK